MTGRRRRSLSTEERVLWKQVAKTAAPLRPGEAEPEPPTSASPPATPPPKKKPAAVSGTEPKPPPRKRGPAPPVALDRRTIHRVARGTIAIDGRIDLHGFTQEEAHDRLLGYLAKVQSGGGRIILVITGKGSPDRIGDRGVLRRAVPHWLSSPAFRLLVSGYEEAHRTHGGSGALYVRVRKLR